jgi:hypothetical protein
MERNGPKEVRMLTGNRGPFVLYLEEVKAEKEESILIHPRITVLVVILVAGLFVSGCLLLFPSENH